MWLEKAMRSLSKAWIVPIVGIAIAGTTWLQAAPDDSEPPPSKAIGSTVGKLSPAEMSVRIGELEVRVKEDARHVLHLQAFARKSKDVIKLNCINDKLVQMKAQNNIFDNVHGSLTPLLVSGVEDANRYALFGELTLGSENVHKLRQEADACVGEPEIAGESANTFTGPTLSDDPTKGDVWGTGVEPPGYASPFN